MSGSDFIRRIKLDHAFRGLPCVLLTAAQESEAEVVALDSGADAFVRKEEDPEVMLAKLARALHSPVQSANDEIGERPLDAQKVLAVDDSLTFRHRLVDELSSEGYSVLQASSGEEALEIVR